MDSYLSKFEPNYSLETNSKKDRLEEYGRFQQHLILLEDLGRVESYISALDQIEPGETVVDVGAGTGILGMLALKRGFKHAYLIEPSRKIGAYARHLAAINGFSDRVTVIESTLESLDFSLIPNSIDLVITETISSLIFGFGSWDTMPLLIERVKDKRSVIPLKGNLYLVPSTVELATRGPHVGGLSALASAGINIDLHSHTFRSGGNIYDKGPIAKSISTGAQAPVKVASFDFSRNSPISISGGEMTFREDTNLTGVVAFWEITLSDGDSPVTMNNLDPRVTSWYPYYIAFSSPVEIMAEESFEISLKLLAIDSPYKYAFKLISNDQDLTNALYW